MSIICKNIVHIYRYVYNIHHISDIRVVFTVNICVNVMSIITLIKICFKYK